MRYEPQFGHRIWSSSGSMGFAFARCSENTFLHTEHTNFVSVMTPPLSLIYCTKPRSELRRPYFAENNARDNLTPLSRGVGRYKGRLRCLQVTENRSRARALGGTHHVAAGVILVGYAEDLALQLVCV